MCKLVELIDFITKKYGHVKLYIHMYKREMFMLAEDLPHSLNNHIVTSFKYNSICKQLDVYVKEENKNVSETEEISK